MKPSVLILDYSTDKSETDYVKKYIQETPVSGVFVYHGGQIPDVNNYTHVIHTGSALSICKDAEFFPEAEVLIHRCIELGIAQMGICYGHQLLCRALCGMSAVRKCVNGPEVGWNHVGLCGSSLVIDEILDGCRIFESHFDEVTMLPEGSEIVLTNSHTEIQAFMNKRFNLFSVQFHPEFDLAAGNKLIENDRVLFEGHGIDVNKVLEGSPSLDAGRTFFGYFMREFKRKGKQ